MSFRSPAVWIVFLFVTVFAMPGRAADFVDSAERYVVLPDRIGRVMAADQSAAVLVFVLAPEKLVGWSRPLTRELGREIGPLLARQWSAPANQFLGRQDEDENRSGLVGRHNPADPVGQYDVPFGGIDKVGGPARRGKECEDQKERIARKRTKRH